MCSLRAKSLNATYTTPLGLIVKEECSIKTIKMKTLKLKSRLRFLLTLCLLLILGSCNQMSEQIKDEFAGMNGGFEVAKNGIPINWLMYTPNTVKDADFKIVLDNEVYKEGRQSLRFDVVKCSSIGGRFSPGFTNEFFESGKFEGESSYKLSFWVKNDGSAFRISAGGVSAKKGNMTILIDEDKQISDWKHLEYQIDIPKNNWLRLELNVLEPGTFWIDDIQIDKESS